MSLTMYSASVPVYQRVLRGLDAILDKAAAWASERKIEPEALLKARLAPDMFHLTRQVQIATDMAGSAAVLDANASSQNDASEFVPGSIRARGPGRGGWIPGCGGWIP